MTELSVFVEAGAKRSFAGALAWPGWCRSGKSDEAALQALAGYRDRYRAIVERWAPAHLAELTATALESTVVERAPGSSGTEFGVPTAILERDRRPLGDDARARLAVLVQAAWGELDRVVANAPTELRKGPRGGGRDRDPILAHVLESEVAYARKLGVSLGAAVTAEAVERRRAAMLASIASGSSSEDPAWPVPYAARRIAWHAIDHAWEIEDRSPS